MAPESRYVQTPKQARSRRTLERIARAALELIGDQGVEATSVSQIVDRAGSSIGSFYARFSGKEELIHYLEERVWSDAQHRWDRAVSANAWGELPLDEVVQGLVRLFVQVERVAGRTRRALASRVSGTNAQASPANRFRAHLEAGVMALLGERTAEMRHPRPEEAVALGYRVLSAAIRDVVAEVSVPDDGGSGGTFLDDDVLAAELATMWLAYLGAVPPGSDAPAEDVDFFEIWG